MTNRRVVGFILLLLLLIVGFWLGIFMKLLRSRGGNPAGKSQLLAMFVNVGDGDAAFIRTPNGLSMLIDSGPDEAAAREVIADTRLMQSGPPQIIVLTSTRARSIGGLPYILAHTAFNGTVVLPCSASRFAQLGGSAAHNLLIEAQRQHVQVMSWSEFEASKSQVLNTDPAAQATLIPVTEPVPGGRAQTAALSQAGASALAVRIDYGSSGLLYTAGLLPLEESLLIATRAHLPCDVLAATDSGLKGTLSYEFLALAAPRITAVSGSVSNPLDPDVEDRLNAADVKVDRTDTLGTFTLGLSDNTDSPIMFYGPQANLPLQH